MDYFKELQQSDCFVEAKDALNLKYNQLVDSDHYWDTDAGLSDAEIKKALPIFQAVKVLSNTKGYDYPEFVWRVCNGDITLNEDDLNLLNVRLVEAWRKQRGGKKTAVKKTAVKKTATKKPAAKKPVAKKPVAAKKPAAKKPVVAKKSVAAKKTVAKK